MGAIVRKTKVSSIAVALLINTSISVAGEWSVQKLACMGVVKFHLVGRKKEAEEIEAS